MLIIKNKLQIVLIILLIIGAYYYNHVNVKYHNVVSSGTLTGKGTFNHTNYIFFDHIKTKECILLKVRNKKIWNMLKFKDVYTFTYEWKNNEIPTLIKLEKYELHHNNNNHINCSADNNNIKQCSGLKT